MVNGPIYDETTPEEQEELAEQYRVYHENMDNPERERGEVFQDRYNMYRNEY